MENALTHNNFDLKRQLKGVFHFVFRSGFS